MIAWLKALFHKPLVPVHVSDRELRDRLQRVVEKYRLVVMPRTSQMWSRNKGSYGKDTAGRYHVHTQVIELRPDFFLSPWVLAYEIGHHVAITERQDFTEAGADAAGKAIVLSLLSEAEKLGMAEIVDGMFK